jgi:hypothetical protein
MSGALIRGKARKEKKEPTILRAGKSGNVQSRAAVAVAVSGKMRSENRKIKVKGETIRPEVEGVCITRKGARAGSFIR